MVFDLKFPKCGSIFFLIFYWWFNAIYCIMYVAVFNLFWKIEEINQKQTYFLALCKRFFVHALWWPINYAAKLCKVKDLIETYNRSKRHHCSLYGGKVTSKFSISNQHPCRAHYGGVFWPFLPPDIVKFWWNFQQK